MQTKFIAVVN